MVAAPFSELLGPNAVTSLPVAAPAFVITAENPGGLTSNADSNTRYVDELRSALEEEGVPLVPVQAGEGDWQEASLLVSETDLSPDRVFDLAKRFGQHSVFRLDEDHVNIVRVEDEQVLHRQPRRPSPQQPPA